MNRTVLISNVLIGILLIAAVPAISRGANSLSGADRDDGWRLLFDGTSLSGWRGLDSAEPGTGWKAADGAIIRTAKSGDLLTTDEFGDFDLSIEWKVEDATNSGILYRVSTSERQTFFTGPEYQILDNVNGGDRHDPKHRAGALYDLVAPAKDFTRPVGVWNETRIMVKGWHVQHWLNGEKIVDVDLANPEGQSLVAHSKFKDMPHFAHFTKGHIALQDHDGSVSFRNIKIRELGDAR